MTRSKQGNFIPIPGDRMLEAIGTVAVKWSALEFQIDNILYWASSPHDPSVTRILNSYGVQQRWEHLKGTLRRDYPHHPGTPRLIVLVDRALSIKGERDAIIHGLYAAPTSAASKAEAVIFTLKSHKSRPDWPISRPRVLEAAQKVDVLLAELINHLLDHGEKLGNSILPNAWRHKDHA